MKVCTLGQFYAGVDLPLSFPPEFVAIGDRTASRTDKKGKMVRQDYGRGVLLYRIAQGMNPERVLEFGTGRGYGTACLALGCESGVVESYDVRDPDEEFVNVSYEGVKETTTTRKLLTDVLPKKVMQRIKLFGCSSEEAQLERSAYDLCFVDGSHLKQDVLEDADRVFHAVRPGGVIVFHDYQNPRTPGVTEALDEWLERDSTPSYLVRADSAVATDIMLPGRKGQTVTCLVLVKPSVKDE